MIIAGIGTREPSAFQYDAAEKLARFLVANGHTISTGGALGIDQCFMRGGSSVDPSKVVVCLPWRSYERNALVEGNRVLCVDDLLPETYARLEKEAATHHPAWARLSGPVRKLMIRNGLIIEGCDLVLACPSPKGGGTKHGMSVSQARGIRLVDFSSMTREDLSALCQEFLSGQDQST